MNLEELKGIRATISIENHLRYNHYPPVDERFVPVCKRAIRACATGKPDTFYVLPNNRRLKASVICDGLHLWSYVDEIINGEADKEAGIWRAEGEMK